MGKILDTITVLFKGDTEDLKRKKKEAEDLAAETAKNIKEIQASTAATNTTLDTTNKTLTQTDNLTTNIGEGIAAWIVAAHQASSSINEAIGAEKAHREQVRIEKSLTTTKKGANAVETAIKGVAKEFAAAALGALTVGRAVGLFKDVVSGTLDLQRASLSLNIDPATIDAYGRAAQAAGSSIEEYTTALENLSAKSGGLTGAPIQSLLQTQLNAIHAAQTDLAAEALGRQFQLSPGLIRAARTGAFTEENLANIRKVDSGIDEATQKVKLLNEAWTEFKTNIRGTFVDFENYILPPLTKFLENINSVIAKSRLLAEAEAKQGVTLFKYILPNATAPKQVPTFGNFPLTKGNTSVANTSSVKISNVNVHAPRGVDPDYWARSITSELEHQIWEMQQYYNGPKVG